MNAMKAEKKLSAEIFSLLRVSYYFNVFHLMRRIFGDFLISIGRWSLILNLVLRYQI